MDTPTAPTIRAWKPAVPGIREVLHARHVDHAYPPHTHDAWTLFIVDSGAIRYDLGRHARGATPGSVSILPPHVVHDGRTAAADGYRKRVLYLEPDVVGEDRIGAAVDGPALADIKLRGAIAHLHDTLACVDDALESETRLGFVVERLRRALGTSGGSSPVGHREDLGEALRAWLDAHLFEPLTLAAAAAELDAGPAQLARAYARDFEMPPHAYVLGRRLDAARDRILDGQSLATVAADVGFFDQAHLTRRFKRFLGITPGQYARSAGRRS